MLQGDCRVDTRYKFVETRLKYDRIVARISNDKGNLGTLEKIADYLQIHNTVSTRYKVQTSSRRCSNYGVTRVLLLWQDNGYILRRAAILSYRTSQENPGKM